MSGNQSIGIAYGVILAVGIATSFTVFLVLFRKLEKWRNTNVMNYIKEEASSHNNNHNELGNSVNYKADSEFVEIPQVQSGVSN